MAWRLPYFNMCKSKKTLTWLFILSIINILKLLLISNKYIIFLVLLIIIPRKAHRTSVKNIKINKTRKEVQHEKH